MKEDHEGTRAVLPGEKGFPFIDEPEGPGRQRYAIRGYLP